jgi:hypothetical protein
MPEYGRHKALNLLRYFPEIVSLDVLVPWKTSDSCSAIFITGVYGVEFHFIFFIRLYAFACYSPRELISVGLHFITSLHCQIKLDVLRRCMCVCVCVCIQGVSRL